jgi:hypothetical protein
MVIYMIFLAKATLSIGIFFGCSDAAKNEKGVSPKS